MTPRITIDHLWALISATEMAAEFMSNADEDDPNNAKGLREVELASQSRDWLRAEIYRRERRKVRR